MTSVAVHWFRNGLRLHDNPALLAAIGGCTHLLPVYVLDPAAVKPLKMAENRLWFLLETLRSLDRDLKAKGSGLLICLGDPVEVIPAIVKSTKARALFYEFKGEPFARKIDENVKAALGSDVKVEAVHGHTLFDQATILKKNGGSAPLTMGAFQKLAAKMGSPKKPEDAPVKLPPLPQSPEIKESFKVYKNCPEVEQFADLGYDAALVSKVPFEPGESKAIEKLEEFLKQKSRTLKFEKPQTNPTSLEPDTTALSPYMSNGSLSCRLFYHRLMDVYKGSSHSKPPVSLEGQLLWREMAYLIGYSVPNFERMVGNPICRQIPWKTGKEAEELLKKWEMGQTGYPAVDAVMNQLRTEGWMHHLARHLTACFLTRGDLWVSWELGRDVFERHLLDADWSINNFSWHWLSCSAFFYQYFRCYSPVAFFKKTDPSGSYIRKHVPLLKKFPDKYIYEPWDMTKNEQKAAGCVIGEDYPKRIVDHAKVCKENMDKMKKAYDAAKKADGEPQNKKAKLN